jgi:hypothetical protein
MLLRSLDGCRNQRWRGNKNRFGNADIDREGHHRSTRDSPLDIDGVIIGRESAEGWAWRGRRRADMYVRERRDCGVIEIFRVDVTKWRLNEAPEKGGSAQDCARCPHDFLC